MTAKTAKKTTPKITVMTKPMPAEMKPKPPAQLPNLQAPFSASSEPDAATVKDVAAFTTSDMVVEALYAKKQQLIAVVREATSPIPDSISDMQKRALEVVRAEANSSAMRSLGEFSAFLSVARAARWLDFGTYCDGIETLTALLSHGPKVDKPAS